MYGDHRRLFFKDNLTMPKRRFTRLWSIRRCISIMIPPHGAPLIQRSVKCFTRQLRTSLWAIRNSMKENIHKERKPPQKKKTNVLWEENASPAESETSHITFIPSITQLYESSCYVAWQTGLRCRWAAWRHRAAWRDSAKRYVCQSFKDVKIF